MSATVVNGSCRRGAGGAKYSWSDHNATSIVATRMAARQLTRTGGVGGGVRSSLRAVLVTRYKLACRARRGRDAAENAACRRRKGPYVGQMRACHSERSRGQTTPV